MADLSEDPFEYLRRRFSVPFTHNGRSIVVHGDTEHSVAYHACKVCRAFSALGQELRELRRLTGSESDG